MLGKGTGPVLARREAKLCLYSHGQAGFPTLKNPGHPLGAGIAPWGELRSPKSHLLIEHILQTSPALFLFLGWFWGARAAWGCRDVAPRGWKCSRFPPCHTELLIGIPAPNPFIPSHGIRAKSGMAPGMLPTAPPDFCPHPSINPQRARRY